MSTPSKPRSKSSKAPSKEAKKKDSEKDTSGSRSLTANQRSLRKMIRENKKEMKEALMRAVAILKEADKTDYKERQRRKDNNLCFYCGNAEHRIQDCNLRVY